MGAARIEIVRLSQRRSNHPDHVVDVFQVENVTTSTTVTVEDPDARVAVANVSQYRDLHAIVVCDEACYMAVGADPTAGADEIGYLLSPNVPRTIAVRAGDKFSFIDVA